jgi:thiamine-monophosphate kinase
MDVGELGEFGLIERLQKTLGAPSDERLIVGIGDDAAVWRNGETFTIATTDTMVENVHFLPGKVAWRDIGWKALAVNISDIAAMGGTPTFALVTLSLPAGTPAEHIDEIYAGLHECAAAYSISIAGGDIVSSAVLSISVALMGEARVDHDDQPLLLRRDAARPGDVIAVTGPLGGSAGGLRALLAGNDAQYPELVAAHMHPWPRWDAAHLAVVEGIRCGIDISDGLVQDLGHVCRASDVGADIQADDVPRNASLVAAFPDEARSLALSGGEDYELLLIGSEAALSATDTALRRGRASDVQQLHTIGRITSGKPVVRVLDASGREVELASSGWDHLKRQDAP